LQSDAAYECSEIPLRTLIAGRGDRIEGFRSVATAAAER